MAFLFVGVLALLAAYGVWQFMRERQRRLDRRRPYQMYIGVQPTGAVVPGDGIEPPTP